MGRLMYEIPCVPDGPRAVLNDSPGAIAAAVVKAREDMLAGREEIIPDTERAMDGAYIDAADKIAEDRGLKPRTPAEAIVTEFRASEDTARRQERMAAEERVAAEETILRGYGAVATRAAEIVKHIADADGIIMTPKEVVEQKELTGLGSTDRIR